MRARDPSATSPEVISVKRRRIRNLSQKTVDSHFVQYERSFVSPETRALQGTEEGRGEVSLQCETQYLSFCVSRVNVAVAVADDAQGRIYEVAAACRAMGLAHTATLAVVGVLTGSMESADLVKLWTVPGVLAVEVESELRAGITGRTQCHGRGD
jgi:hypothetical protein